MIQSFKEEILVIDAGSGTQDILCYRPGQAMENCPQMIVPSRTQIVGKLIQKAAAEGKSIYLDGHLMGGGPSGRALQHFLSLGLKGYASPKAALTFDDNLQRVEQMGVILTEKQPPGTERIWLGDLDLDSLKTAFGAFGLDLPPKVAIALQDHGFSPFGSNRKFRFKLWEQFLTSRGELKDLLFKETIPAEYTRMQALREIVPDAVITDTGTAALLGIISDPMVQTHLERGIIALNIGNSHTLGAAIRGNRVYGIFEHHTGMLNPEALASLVSRFQKAELTNEEIFNAGGHGAFLHPEMNSGWDYVAMTGPRREMAKDLGWYAASPYGDMMLTGCFGILKGLDII